MQNASRIYSTLLTLLIGLVGAVMFHGIGFSVPMLTGPAVLVSCAALLGLRMQLLGPLKPLCFTLLGIVIGCTVTPDVLRAALAWPFSFSILAVCVVCTTLLCRWGLYRLFGFDWATASLCALPGHLSFVLAYSEDVAANTSVVAVVQSIRVLFLSLGVPAILAIFFAAPDFAAAPLPTLNLKETLTLAMLALAVGSVFQHMRLPAGFLLGGLVISSLGQLSSLVDGRLADPLEAAALSALSALSALIGSRFNGIQPSMLKSVFFAGLFLTCLSIVMAALGSLCVVALLDLDLAILLISFAPGGVEAMAAIAAEMGLNPAFVAGHHVWRLIILTLLISALGLVKPQR